MWPIYNEHNVIAVFFAGLIFDIKNIVDHPAFKVVHMMFVVAFNLFGVHSGYTSSFYYFENGMSLGKALTGTFTEFDKWSKNKSIIVPTKPWIRR